VDAVLPHAPSGHPSLLACRPPPRHHGLRCRASCRAMLGRAPRPQSIGGSMDEEERDRDGHSLGAVSPVALHS
jgi:hypothetical protein